MADELYECSWGSIRLFATDIQTESGRTKVVHDLTNGDVHPVQDRGRKARRAKLKLVFDEFAGFPAPLEAVRTLESALASGQSAMFSHPLLGSYMAGVGDFEWQHDSSDNFTADCEFIPDGDVPAISPAGAGTTGISGEQAVGVAADAFDTESRKVMTDEEIRAILEDDSGVTISEDAKVSVASWAAPEDILDRDELLAKTRIGDLNRRIASTQASAIQIRQQLENDAALAQKALKSAQDKAQAARAVAVAAASGGTVTDDATAIRRVLIDSARLSDRISTAIEEGGFERDIQLWPCFRSSVMLGESIRSAAVAATSEVPATFRMRVQEPTALIPLAARVYGGPEAQDRARQIVSMNDIATPAWLPPGDYLFPARTSARRSAF